MGMARTSCAAIGSARTERRDARQDQDHAGHAEQMRDLLRTDAVLMDAVLSEREMDGDVADARRDHDDQTRSAQQRKPAQVCRMASCSVYHQHLSVIHRGACGVNSIYYLSL
jgi:hypothetical protein